MKNETKEQRIWLGIIFIAIGAFLTLRKLDILPFIFPHEIFSWKGLMIGIGLILLTIKENKQAGIWMIAIGGLFLLQDYTFFSFRMLFEYWPVILVAIGISLILSKKAIEKNSSTEKEGSEN